MRCITGKERDYPVKKKEKLVLQGRAFVCDTPNLIIGKMVKLCLGLINSTPSSEDVWGSGRIPPAPLT
jgi:hypothetical protein